MLNLPKLDFHTTLSSIKLYYPSHQSEGKYAEFEIRAPCS